MSAYDWDPWNYRENVYSGREGDVTGGLAEDTTGRRHNLVGFRVEATDGSIGKVDDATDEVGASYVVVDTGPWIFGRRVMLPAGTIERVDWDDQAIYVDRTKDEITDSPELGELGENAWDDPDYRDRLGGYYGNYYGPRV